MKIFSKSKYLNIISLFFVISSCGTNETIQNINIDLDKLSKAKNTIEKIADKKEEKKEEPKPIRVESISTSHEAITLNLGEEKTLTATVKYSDGSTNNDVNWDSTPSEVVGVTPDGKIKANRAGVAIIKIVSKKDADKKAQIAVTVISKIPQQINQPVNQPITNFSPKPIYPMPSPTPIKK